MKWHYYLLLLLVLVLSCKKEKVNTKYLIGSWKTRDVIKLTNENIADKMTFFDNDSISIEIFQDGKRVEQMSGKYKLDTLHNRLTVIYDTVVTTHDIIRLTKSEMELFNLDTKSRYRCLRY